MITRRRLSKSVQYANMGSPWYLALAVTSQYESVGLAVFYAMLKDVTKFKLATSLPLCVSEY